MANTLHSPWPAEHQTKINCNDQTNKQVSVDCASITSTLVPIYPHTHSRTAEASCLPTMVPGVRAKLTALVWLAFLTVAVVAYFPMAHNLSANVGSAVFQRLSAKIDSAIDAEQAAFIRSHQEEAVMRHLQLHEHEMSGDSFMHTESYVSTQAALWDAPSRYLDLVCVYSVFEVKTNEKPTGDEVSL